MILCMSIWQGECTRGRELRRTGAELFFARSRNRVGRSQPPPPQPTGGLARALDRWPASCATRGGFPPTIKVRYLEPLEWYADPAAAPAAPVQGGQADSCSPKPEDLSCTR